MVLHADSDTAYLVLPNAKSRIAGHFYLRPEINGCPANVFCSTEKKNALRTSNSLSAVHFFSARSATVNFRQKGGRN